jgi:hypothetical protein
MFQSVALELWHHAANPDDVKRYPLLGLKSLVQGLSAGSEYRGTMVRIPRSVVV